MKLYSTGEVAKLIKVHKQTLLDWMRDRKIPEPERQVVAGLEVRVWTAKDVQIAREYRTINYGKWNPKKRKKTR